jgi:hypothetical protein
MREINRLYSTLEQPSNQINIADDDFHDGNDPNGRNHETFEINKDSEELENEEGHNDVGGSAGIVKRAENLEDMGNH